MAERTVDFAALARVSSRAELTSIRLAEVSAKCDTKVTGPLEAGLENACEVVGREANTLQVASSYSFIVHIAQAEVAKAAITYILDYELRGNEPFADEDIAEFAFANGTLHSWPFVREFVYELTARMGYPPYTLPAFHFKPKPPQKEEVEKTAPIQEPPATDSQEKAT